MSSYSTTDYSQWNVGADPIFEKESSISRFIPFSHNVVALLLLPLLCAIGFIGNAMVCVAIATDKRLQNVTNYFLFSLALADLFVCCIVMPLAILAEARHGKSKNTFSFFASKTLTESMLRKTIGN